MIKIRKDLVFCRNARHAKVLPYKKVRARTATRHLGAASFDIDRARANKYGRANCAH
jgi:hypothetical protein